MNRIPLRTLLALLLVSAITLHARAHLQPPQLINYQGRVAVNKVDFQGLGHFKFALVDNHGTTTYWSNDGTSAAASEPAAVVVLNVTEGRYSVLVGDATVPNMSVVPATVFTETDLRLRVWFDDGTHGSQLLAPDQRIAPSSVRSKYLEANVVPSALVFSANGNTAPVGANHVRIGTTTTADARQQLINGPPPVARREHTAVWTGSEMIVWGGYYSNGTVHHFHNGGRYNPTGNSWRP